MKETVGVHWFRHGLRLHDNPALCQLLETCDRVYLIFVFDGESGGKHRVRAWHPSFFIFDWAQNDLEVAAP